MLWLIEPADEKLILALAAQARSQTWNILNCCLMIRCLFLSSFPMFFSRYSILLLQQNWSSSSLYCILFTYLPITRPHTEFNSIFTKLLSSALFVSRALVRCYLSVDIWFSFIWCNKLSTNFSRVIPEGDTKPDKRQATPDPNLNSNTSMCHVMMPSSE